MIILKIESECKTINELCDMLGEIKRQIENGNTEGYYPTWQIEGDEEEEDINEKSFNSK